MIGDMEIPSPTETGRQQYDWIMENCSDYKREALLCVLAALARYAQGSDAGIEAMERATSLLLRAMMEAP